MQPLVDESDTVISESTRLELYQRIMRIRRFEEQAYRLFMQRLVKGTSHLSTGQEAVASGFATAMRNEDYTFCSYRGHAHTLARGVPMPDVMAELMGRRVGVCGGKGGSMHITSVEHGVMGSYAIVGAHMPIAAGAGWSSKARNSGQVTVCFFGDGATNIGAFHEALNLAATWKLPVVFVCENNLYMEYTPISHVTAVGHPAADRASAYGLEPVLIDGNDPDAVYKTACVTIDHARVGEGPALVEAQTYRHGGHSRADPGKYRPDEEVEAWLQRDPVVTYRKQLLEQGVDESKLSEIDRAAEEAVSQATETAENSAIPDPSDAFANLWADGGTEWRN